MQSLAPAQRSRQAATAMPAHVCIVGGSFGGLYTALYLEQRCRRWRFPCQITLIEPRDRFLFTPLLYEVLTTEVLPWEIAPTYRQVLRGSPIRHLQQRAEQIDLAARQVTLTQGTSLSYDYLVVAIGSRGRALPLPGWTEYTLSFRTLADALHLEERLSTLMADSPDPIRVALVGGGPSGVELACKLADRLGPRGHLSLIDRGDRLLKTFSERIQRAALRALARRRISLHLQTAVVAVGPDYLQVQTPKGGQRWPAHLVIGVAGTQPRPWPGKPSGLALTPEGRVLTHPTLQTPPHPEVFVVGDQAAYQAADTVAQNLLALMQQRSPRPFRYHHLGDMMTLGYRNALVASAGLVLQGRLASILRQAAYTYRLPPGGGHRWRVLRDRLRRRRRSPKSL